MPNNKPTFFLILIAVVAIVTISAVFGYALGIDRKKSIIAPVRVRSVDLSVANSSTTTQTAAESPSIVWQKPMVVPSLHLFFNGNINEENIQYTNIDNTVTYYKLGTLTTATSSANIILAHGSGMGFDASNEFIFLSYPGKFVLLSRYSWIDEKSTSSIGTEGLLRNKFTVDASIDLADLDFPQTITGPNSRQVLERQNTVSFVDFSVSTGTLVFTDNNGNAVHSETERNGFYVRKPGPFISYYSLKPDFYDKDNLTPQIIWNDGSKNETEYAYTSFGGCGSSNYANVVASGTLNINTDLIVAGKNNQGDLIYELKNKNHEWLKNLFNDFSTDPPLKYEKFLATRPLLYWVDPFGRLVELQNKKFQPQTECGKPVIYLYPEKTTKVSVKLSPQGGFTYSEPAYNGGWNVVAEPNGTLHVAIGDSDRSRPATTQDKTYPYLFWEGRGGLYETPKQGWVVKKAEVESFLTNKLAALGLNKKESSDFMEFWLPRILSSSPSQRRGQGEVSRGSPFYFITFMGNSTMDKLAPLTVEPKPNTVIRVLMDFTPLDAPLKVEPFNIRTPERKGFTVVEWGGVL